MSFVLVNAFTQVTSSGITQFPLVDPRCVREHRERFRRDLFPELDYANSYYSMAGRWPDIGWILLDRNSYNQINTYLNTFQLTISDLVNPPLTITNLSIVQARCVTRGLPSDPGAIYLVQLTNNEGILYNPWFQFPITAQYNVRSPAYDGTYITGSLNGTAAWTWSGMIQDIWNRAIAFLGAYPGLPISPLQAPEGFCFVGVPLWEALSSVMDYLGLSISGNFPSFTITVPGAIDLAYNLLLLKYAKNLEDSMEYIDTGSGRVPGSVVVIFHVRTQFYGQEETVTFGDDLNLADVLANQWQSAPVYSVTVPAPAAFQNAVGVGYIWADFTVRQDHDGNLNTSDVTQAQATAVERATQFFNTIYRGTAGFSKNVYGGVIPFNTGSQVDGVRWSNTGKHGELNDPWSGWRTEVIRGYLWDEATFPLTSKGLTGPV